VRLSQASSEVDRSRDPLILRSGDEHRARRLHVDGSCQRSEEALSPFARSCAIDPLSLSVSCPWEVGKRYATSRSDEQQNPRSEAERAETPWSEGRLIFPYKEEVGGSSPSTPTNRKPLSQARKPYVARVFGFLDPPVLMR